MPYLRVDEGDLYYRRRGDGPLLVCVNDWVLSQAYWQSGVDYLAKNFCCVTYDPRGVGKSRGFGSSASFTIEAHAEDLHRLIESMRSGYAHLVGHGLGAMVAGICLRRHPQDGQSLSLIAPETELLADERLQGRVKYIQSLIILRRFATWPLIRSLTLRRYSMGRLPAEARKDLLADFSRLNPRASWEAIGTALEHQVHREFIAGVIGAAVPVLVLACGQDKLSSVEGARALFSRINRGRLVSMHRGSHFPMVEWAEKFAEVLGDFLTIAVSPQ